MSKGEGWGKEMSKGGRGGAGMDVSRDLVWWSRIKKYYQLSCSGLTRTSKHLFELEFVDGLGSGLSRRHKLFSLWWMVIGGYNLCIVANFI